MVKGEWEPIISEALWYKAQECRNNRKVTIINTDDSKMKYGQPSEMNMYIVTNVGTKLIMEEERT